MIKTFDYGQNNTKKKLISSTSSTTPAFMDLLFGTCSAESQRCLKTLGIPILESCMISPMPPIDSLLKVCLVKSSVECSYEKIPWISLPDWEIKQEAYSKPS